MVFGRRSEKRLPESASGWAGTLFDEQWAKEGSLAQVEHKFNIELQFQV
ncbi:hypothetical protein [Prevotella ihumii]|nr:hypothetical protein [Prevotella ihumii]